jgi:aspartate racemase
MKQLRMPGIIGGLGPAAHVEFEKRLLMEGDRRGARQDQDHIEWVLISATTVPERTEAVIARDTQLCIEALAAAAQRLVAAGAEFAAVPCNTAHALRDAVMAIAPLPWLDLIDVTCELLRKSYSPGSKVLVLETTGTMQTGLYRERLRAAEFEPVEFAPDSPEQAEVMRAIYDSEFGIKATGARVDSRALKAVSDALRSARTTVSCAVAGCTEISVAMAAARDSVLAVIDPLDALAAATYDVALGLRRLPQLPVPARR